VKPANVVVGPGRGAVLVDVGSASALPGDPALTVTGELVGTLGYLAPEQLAGGPATPASDVYGLGMVLLGELERATGVTGDPAERMGSVAERVASLAAPPAVRAALERCLAESPAQRPPAGEVRALLTGAPAVAGPEPAGALRLEDEGRVVHLPDGEVLDLSKRTAPRLILRRLVAHHRARLSRGLSWEELAEAGWPGERMSPDSARGRVYVAVYTLRRLGLDDALLRRDDGYLLDPRLRVAEDA
jgi:serine/threonine protein kinase